MSNWRIGLVGIGRGSGYGRVFAHDPRCEIVACCDANAEALGRFQSELELPDAACFTSYDDFVGADLDIVFVGTPIPYHREQVVKALVAGKHVLSEVTAAPTVADCAEIVNTVRRTGQTYMLAENCCYWPFVQDWKALVDGDKLGRVLHAECEYLHPIPTLIFDPATGQKKWRSVRPPLHYCSHSLGPILMITDDRIVRASGLGNTREILPNVEEPGGIDLQIGLFETAKGMTIKLLRTSLLPRKPAIHYYQLLGTKGYVESGRKGMPGKGLLYLQEEMDDVQELDIDIVDTSLPESARAGGHGTAEYSLVQEFLGALEAGRKPAIDEVRGMDFTVPGIMAHESAMQGGKWLDVPYLG